MPRSWRITADFEAFLADGGIVEVDDDLPDQYRMDVFGSIADHAHRALAAGLAEETWSARTPGMRAKMAALARTQDRIGHALMLLMVAGDLRIRTRAQLTDDLFVGRAQVPRVVVEQPETFADHIVKTYLVDSAVLAANEATLETSTYGPYVRVLARVAEEGRIHMRLGEGDLRHFADGPLVVRSDVQASVDRWWPGALQVFDSGGLETARERWHAAASSVLESVGIDTPVQSPAWVETSSLTDPDVGMIAASANWKRNGWVRGAMA